MVIISPLNRESKLETAAPEISRNKSGWKIRAKMPANRVDRNRVMMEGTFRAINMPVAIGIISSHGGDMKLFVQGGGYFCDVLGIAGVMSTVLLW